MIENTKKKPGAANISTNIRKAILNGELNFKDKLPPERVMAESYHVSRGTIRSALNMLEADNYIAIKPGSGAFVSFEKTKVIMSQVENANPLELIDARFAIEPHICRLAILHGKREHFDKLDTLMTMMENNTDHVKEFAVADTNFHKTLAESTGNNLLIWIIVKLPQPEGFQNGKKRET